MRKLNDSLLDITTNQGCEEVVVQLAVIDTPDGLLSILVQQEQRADGSFIRLVLPSIKLLPSHRNVAEAVVRCFHKFTLDEEIAQTHDIATGVGQGLSQDGKCLYLLYAMEGKNRLDIDTANEPSSTWVGQDELRWIFAAAPELKHQEQACNNAFECFKKREMQAESRRIAYIKR